MLGRLLGRNSKDSNDDEMPQEPQRTTKVNLEDVQKRILIGSDAIVELDKHYKGLTSADADQQEIKSVISEIRQNFDKRGLKLTYISAFSLNIDVKYKKSDHKKVD